MPRQYGSPRKRAAKSTSDTSTLHKGRAGNATQRDVARLAGVSQSAVSRVYGNSDYVADDVRQRIEAAAQQLRYQPDALARGLISGRSSIVAIVMADIGNPFYPYVLDLLTDSLQRRGLQVLLFNAARGQTVDDLIPSVLQYRVQGIIITTASLSSGAATLCADNHVPVVMFNRYTHRGGAHAVACDNVLGGEMAADTLADADCRYVAYIGGVATSSTNEDRKRGFVSRMESAAFPLLSVVDHAFTYEWGSEAVDRILVQWPQLDGLFCADDAIAFGAIDSLRYRHNLPVPGKVSVVG